VAVRQPSSGYRRVRRTLAAEGSQRRRRYRQKRVLFACKFFERDGVRFEINSQTFLAPMTAKVSYAS